MSLSFPPTCLLWMKGSVQYVLSPTLAPIAHSSVSMAPGGAGYSKSIGGPTAESVIFPAATHCC